MRAALYARVSTTDKGQDPETQLRILRDYCAARDWEMTGEYVDMATGSHMKRPQMEQMLSDVQVGLIDVVLVYRFDRFARSTKHLLAALDNFRTGGVAFVSASESIDTSTAVGEMVFTLLAAVAQFERSLISERVKAGMARARAEGKVGRPKTHLELTPALYMLRAGHTLTETAAALRVSRRVLRRRLTEHEAKTGEVVVKPRVKTALHDKR